MATTGVKMRQSSPRGRGVRRKRTRLLLLYILGWTVEGIERRCAALHDWIYQAEEEAGGHDG
jgi:hypothetical protein